MSCQNLYLFPTIFPQFRKLLDGMEAIWHAALKTPQKTNNKHKHTPLVLFFHKPQAVHHSLPSFYVSPSFAEGQNEIYSACHITKIVTVP